MKSIITLFTFLIVTCLFAQTNSARFKDGNTGNQQQNFTYHLAVNCTTSAGIYNSNQALVRTLWVQKKESAGTHIGVWDGLDDLGKPLPFDSYSWKVLYNNVKYTWMGVIGNTSDSMSGPSKHKGLYPITTMCFAGSKGFYGTQYNEAMTNTFIIDTSDVGQRTHITQIVYGGMAPDIIRNCTDGNYVYWVAQDPYLISNSWVYATRIEDNSLISFPSAKAIKTTYGATSYSALNQEFDSVGAITDVSVQKNGNYLFVARRNRVIILNKKTGALIDSITVNGVSFLRIDATDNFLWLNTGTQTTRYSINGNGTVVSTGRAIVSNQPVVALDCNAKYLAICEGGTSQIIKFYNPITGNYIKSFGQIGGYLTNAKVANNKFYWNDAISTYATFIAFTPNNTIWVGDFGNGRVQHFDSSLKLLNRIAWVPVFYNIGVDYGNTSRVFADTREYKVDWKKPLDNGKNGSWTLVNNWGGDIQKYQHNPYEGLYTPLTFPNGHTFCFVMQSANERQLVELKQDGTKIYTGIIIPSTWYLDKSFNLYSQSRTLPNQNITWYKAAFGGYDNLHRPRWDITNPAAIQHSPIITSLNEPGYHGDGTSYRPNSITDDSVFVAFNASVLTGNNAGYHLGGIKNGKWLFKTAKANSTSYKGLFPTGEQFDIGNGVRGAGGICVAFNKNIIWSYHGEFWKGTQTNMFTHTYSNGLVVNQFGIANGSAPGVRGRTCLPGDAGNALSIHVITVNGNTFLLHNDESIQGGIHVWKISGLNTIQLISGSFNQ